MAHYPLSYLPTIIIYPMISYNYLSKTLIIPKNSSEIHLSTSISISAMNQISMQISLYVSTSIIFTTRSMAKIYSHPHHSTMM